MNVQCTNRTDFYDQFGTWQYCICLLTVVVTFEKFVYTSFMTSFSPVVCGDTPQWSRPSVLGPKHDNRVSFRTAHTAHTTLES